MDVVFRVNCSCSAPGENVFIVGACKELGAWNPAEGLACFTSSAAFPHWTSKAVKLPIGSRIDFKAVIRGHGGNRWEQGENRILQVELPADAEAKKMVNLTFGKPGIQDEDAAQPARASGPVASGSIREVTCAGPTFRTRPGFATGRPAPVRLATTA
ncbi:cgtM [Symbiodinium natans]|uniref:CgtM protein n=1 Tax=Symbiodinium natans TaxID=878477 RepID=A0A812KH32_9DINO|nr:cgtM [Symbiodinium natans]